MEDMLRGPNSEAEGPGIYWVFGGGDIGHRRIASEDVRLRHLLSLPEMVGPIEVLGIKRRLLPLRLYGGAAGDTRRYLPVNLPVALGGARRDLAEGHGGGGCEEDQAEREAQRRAHGPPKPSGEVCRSSRLVPRALAQSREE